MDYSKNLRGIILSSPTLVGQLENNLINKTWSVIMAVTLEEFKKATMALESALSKPKDDITRDATILRFEFCVELAWKTSRKLMGSSTTAPKQVVREMAQNKLIQDVDIWLVAIDQRNISSHTYNEELADKVYDFAKSFMSKLKDLIVNLEKV
jgi:nucleotidyltransferase substrate binding protein (TIGR01987 family)